jgi:serine protease Do
MEENKRPQQDSPQRPESWNPGTPDETMQNIQYTEGNECGPNTGNPADSAPNAENPETYQNPAGYSYGPGAGSGCGPNTGNPADSAPNAENPETYQNPAGYSYGPGAGSGCGPNTGNPADGAPNAENPETYQNPAGYSYGPGAGSGCGPNGYGPNGYGPNGYGPNGYGPNGYGPNGYGPNGYGPNGYGPNGYGPNGYGPNGYGPNGYGPNGYGPNGYGPNGYGPNGYGYGQPPCGPSRSGPKKGRGPMNRGTRILIFLLVILLAVFVALFAVSISSGHSGTTARSSSSLPSTSSQPGGGSEQPSSSSSSQVETIQNGGEATKSTISIRKKSGKPLTAEQVFSKVSPSVVGVLAKVPQDGSTDDESQGTGIIASSDGVILTNAHVIGYNGKSKVTVAIPGGKKQYSARILGYDKVSDLAVLKISASGLTAAEFGTESELKVGEQVLAIGNPSGMDYSNSLTGGYVSALDREIAGHSGNGMTYIQTDAAINPGNSGGPLCNLYGQVVGINSCKIISTGYEGMGFAIPLSKAQTIINELITNGYVPGRTRLGITCRAVTSLEQQMLHLPEGVRILSLESDSPLRAAGVEQGDVLYQFAGKSVSSTDSLLTLLAQQKPGDEVQVKIYSVKRKQKLTKSIRLLEDRGETESAASSSSSSASSGK